ncbi:MAG: GMC family oxidoreductase [Thermodesulfovibrionales bacterium]|nr:GMC family oxidoreductase [Thermodesulfovibrionales bacterium]
MIIDARSLPDNETIETDICIVGAGTAGIILAREFIGQKFSVCLLESGGLKPDRETQALYQGENIGHPYYSLDSARARYFGGTTNRWHIPIDDDYSGVRMRPLDAIDFEKRAWVPFSGWPFDKPHLDPFYDRAQEICKITPATYDVADWENPKKTPSFPFNGDRVKTVIFKFGSRHPFLDSYATEVTQAVNITTYLYANVIEIETNETARTVTRLRVVCLEGNKFWVRAKRFILAAGAIEIPRLLLSSNRTQNAGLGNQYNLVGRFFMEHPHFSLGLFAPLTPDIFNFTYLYDHIHKVNGVPIIGKLSISEVVLRQEKLLNHVVELSPTIALKTSLNQFLYPKLNSKSVNSYKILRSEIALGKLPDDFGRHLRNIFSSLDDFTITVCRNIKKRVLRALDKRRIRLFRIHNMTEQAPNPESRVTLGSDRDSLGQRRVRLDWRLSGFDKESAIRSLEIIDQELHRAGLGRLYVELNDETPPHRINGGWHHMGTTRMHTDPKEGVVDENCQVHGIPNLYIAGPSVFPTSGYANPSLTIVALAVRLADHIKRLMV